MPKKKRSRGEETEAPTPVMVETAVRGAIDRVITADAVLYPVNQSNVTAKINAPIKRMLVNRGDHVRAGQLIAELESADLASSVNESQHQYEQTQAAYQALTGATVQDDKAKAETDVQTAQQVLDAAKKVYDSKAALQREGALAQRPVDEARLAMVQAQSQLDLAKRHLETLNQVGQREAIRGAEATMNAAKAHTDNASHPAFLREGRQSDQRRNRGPAGLSGRDGRQRFTHRFHRRHFAGSGARECIREGCRIISRWDGRPESPGPMAISPGRSP